MDKTKLMMKLDELTALAQAHDKRLEMTQVLDCLADETVTPEEMETVYAKLEKRGIQIQAGEEADEPGDEGLLLEEEDDSGDTVSELIQSKYRWSREESEDEDFSPHGDDGEDDEEQDHRDAEGLIVLGFLHGEVELDGQRPAGFKDFSEKVLCQ